MLPAIGFDRNVYTVSTDPATRGDWFLWTDDAFVDFNNASRAQVKSFDPEQISFTTSSKPATATTPTIVENETVVSLHEPRERAKARLRRLRRLQANHDGQGASAPLPLSVDLAIAFVSRLSPRQRCYPTLDDDGSAVIEFDDSDTLQFADIKFFGNGTVECYASVPGEASEMCLGTLEDETIRNFLQKHLGFKEIP